MVIVCNKPYSQESNEKFSPYFEKFPYELSDFQKYAIEAIVEGHHVLTTAHTGSGKTLSAEFAIQYFTSQGKKLIYTSPIKALSNQKYYEFTNKYPHISFGLLTGDIKINPDAQVIIMTAEILMNYLFKGMTNVSILPPPPPLLGKEEIAVNTVIHHNVDFNIDINTELSAVVMDEVHYINDFDRGQVWEKTILMLPSHVQMIMLSATIDAPYRFAQWCEESHKDSGKEVYLASTSKRVVPLTHYAFLTTNESAFKKIKDKAIQSQIKNTTNKFIPLQSENGEFQLDGYLQIKNLVNKIFEPNDIIMKRTHVLNNLMLQLKNEDMLPAIAFVFSRKNVEAYAKEVTTVLLEDDSKVPYIVRRECEQIVRKMNNYQEYLELPEYNQLVNLLEKGIGIHHSGMIPILREIVEIMISKKYIKLLFATESFAIGLDCPIRTAIFTSLTKFDGRDERYLLSHEYTQMAGRAGRRGIDTIGNVIHCNNLFPIPTETEYRHILCGKPQTLISKFRINFPLILNLIKNGQTNNFQDFVEKSMIMNELTTKIDKQKMYIDSLKDDFEKLKKSVQYLRTPIEICDQYNELVEKIPSLINKKRKEAERNLQTVMCNYKFVKDDSSLILKCNQQMKKIDDEICYLTSINSHIRCKVQILIDILIAEGFICFDNDYNGYVLNYKLGNYASCLAEINPVVFSKALVSTNEFSYLTTKQLIGLFSCFTDIKVNQDIRLSVPNSKDEILQNHILILKNLFDKFQSIEDENGITTGFDYENALVFDIIDDVIKWCDCEDEKECKYFIYSVLGEKDISIGDFTKAILKISTIAKELSSLCEQYGLIKLLHKLSKIDGMILKYITTTQSLYV